MSFPFIYIVFLTYPNHLGLEIHHNLLWQETPSSTSPSEPSTEGRKPGSSGGAPRMTKLTDQQKEDIASMASPACMESAERKRQYAAMGRAITKSCNPALLAKYQLCSDTERCGVEPC